MNEAHFKQILNERVVVVVHFSHHVRMSKEVEFPLDLIHACDNYENETRSCCALFPGHKMDLPGSVGIIFEPEHSQILSVCSSDSGSLNYDGIEGSLGEVPTEDAIRESLCIVDSNYNEWRIKGAIPKGIFVADPNNILVKKKLTVPCEGKQIPVISSVKIQLSDVFVAFPNLPVYKMGTKSLEKLSKPPSE